MIPGYVAELSLEGGIEVVNIINTTTLVILPSLSNITNSTIFANQLPIYFCAPLGTKHPSLHYLLQLIAHFLFKWISLRVHKVKGKQKYVCHFFFPKLFLYFLLFFLAGWRAWWAIATPFLRTNQSSLGNNALSQWVLSLMFIVLSMFAALYLTSTLEE